MPRKVGAVRREQWRGHEIRTFRELPPWPPSMAAWLQRRTPFAILSLRSSLQWSRRGAWSTLEHSLESKPRFRGGRQARCRRRRRGPPRGLASLVRTMTSIRRGRPWTNRSCSSPSWTSRYIVAMVGSSTESCIDRDLTSLDSIADCRARQKANELASAGARPDLDGARRAKPMQHRADVSLHVSHGLANCASTLRHLGKSIRSCRHCSIESGVEMDREQERPHSRRAGRARVPSRSSSCRVSSCSLRRRLRACDAPRAVPPWR